jgi:hypothetical protein
MIKLRLIKDIADEFYDDRDAKRISSAVADAERLLGQLGQEAPQ